MIAYATLGVNDMTRAIAFYDGALGPLNIGRITTSETWTGYQRTGDRTMMFLTRPWDRQTAVGGNGPMLAFLAPDRAA